MTSYVYVLRAGTLQSLWRKKLLRKLKNKTWSKRSNKMKVRGWWCNGSAERAQCSTQWVTHIVRYVGRRCPHLQRRRKCMSKLRLQMWARHKKSWNNSKQRGSIQWSSRFTNLSLVTGSSCAKRHKKRTSNCKNQPRTRCWQETRSRNK